MTPFEALIAFTAITLTLGLGWYIVANIFKLIRLKMERKNEQLSGISQHQFNTFRERTEKRLQALEQIVTDDEDSESVITETIEFPVTESNQSGRTDQRESGSRLKNQLKS